MASPDTKDRSFPSYLIENFRIGASEQFAQAHQVITQIGWDLRRQPPSDDIMQLRANTVDLLHPWLDYIDVTVRSGNGSFDPGTFELLAPNHLDLVGEIIPKWLTCLDAPVKTKLGINYLATVDDTSFTITLPQRAFLSHSSPNDAVGIRFNIKKSEVVEEGSWQLVTGDSELLYLPQGWQLHLIRDTLISPIEPGIHVDSLQPYETRDDFRLIMSDSTHLALQLKLKKQKDAIQWKLTNDDEIVSTTRVYNEPLQNYFIRFMTVGLYQSFALGNTDCSNCLSQEDKEVVFHGKNGFDVYFNFETALKTGDFQGRLTIKPAG